MLPRWMRASRPFSSPGGSLTAIPIERFPRDGISSTADSGEVSLDLYSASYTQVSSNQVVQIRLRATLAPCSGYPSFVPDWRPFRRAELGCSGLFHVSFGCSPGPRIHRNDVAAAGPTTSLQVVIRVDFA